MTHAANKEKKVEQTFDLKGNVVLKGDQWKAGVNGEMGQKSNKAEALLLYNCNKDITGFATAAAEFPQKNHNKVAMGVQWNVMAW
mgnify:CR=1 FL=1